MRFRKYAMGIQKGEGYRGEDLESLYGKKNV